MSNSGENPILSEECYKDKIVIKLNGMVSTPLFESSKTGNRSLMRLNTYEGVKRAILEGIKEGKEYQIDLRNAQE